jgi:pyruvate dehydrogenase E1 component beta subunit
MKYLEFINSLIKKQIFEKEKLVLFGQNISAGSCLGGLTRDLSVGVDGMIVNSTNSENSLCGLGFGLMMNGVSSIFFMKQLDFLLLGMDHLVNTYNIIRNHDELKNASFTIFPIVVDNGFQGPQSSLNNLSDFCSMARIEGYTITNKIDAEKIIQSKLISPGFRIITISQRLFNEEIIVPKELIYLNKENTVFQYYKGRDVTIVCFNFSFPQGMKLHNELEKSGIKNSLFNVNSANSTNWKKIIDDVKCTQKLIIIDDSKSKNFSCDSLLVDIVQKCNINKKIILKRNMNQNWLNPVSDKFEIDVKKVTRELIS